MKADSTRNEQLFVDALAQPPAERGAFLAKACGSNVVLLANLVALIAAHEGPESLTPPSPRAADLSALGLAKAEEKAGDLIGRYKLLQKIGEGGCGVVWMAEQEEPVRRRVALKVIKLGMDTKAVVARFEAERQALAMMDHPCIAKVHDAGSTDTGRPFFVMELVRGIPITKYCDENHLTPKERLELFIKVCQAIQHAHQKGVIHRDIKPSNILVTVNDGAPTPKVIDFGIAKATQGKLTDATVFTAFEQFIGTPVYMSPEQAEMSSLDIDTRSDIYSLGVLLYELLTGRPPFDPKAFAQGGVDQIRKQIREMEPPRPSARLRTLDDEERTTIARLRGTAESQLSIALRGDLDWIVMRCLEKDRTRRYDTANGLAMDIHRYLRNEPVVARPPSTGYLLQKLIRRHRLAFATATLVVIALFIASVVSTRHRTLAERARGEAERLVGFLLDEFYLDLAPSGRLEIVAKLAEQAVAYYDRLPSVLRTTDTRRKRATALMRQGAALALQGNAAKSKATLTAAITEFEALQAADPADEEAAIGLALAVSFEGWYRFIRSRFESGAVESERALKVLRPIATASNSSRRARRDFATILDIWSHQHAQDGGIAACEEALRVLAGLGALDLSDLDAASAYADTIDSEAGIALVVGRYDDAVRLSHDALAMSEKILIKHPGHLRALKVRALAYNRIATARARCFQPQPALESIAKSIDAFDTYARSEPAHAVAWRFRLLSRLQAAQALWALGRIAEAEATLRSALALGEQSPTIPAARWPLATLWLEHARMSAQRGQASAAERAMVEAVRTQKALSRDFEPEAIGPIFDREYAEEARRYVQFSFEHYDEFGRAARDALDRLEANANRRDVKKEDVDALRRSALLDVARIAVQLGQYADAEQAAQAAAAARQGNGNWTNLETSRAEAQTWLALAIARQGRHSEARNVVVSALGVYRDLQKSGATGVDFDSDLAFCLYVHAIALAGDPEAQRQRLAVLDEAGSLLGRVPDEAKALQHVRALIQAIDAERG